jgi:hypothetical protein
MTFITICHYYLIVFNLSIRFFLFMHSSGLFRVFDFQAPKSIGEMKERSVKRV